MLAVEILAAVALRRNEALEGALVVVGPRPPSLRSRHIRMAERAFALVGRFPKARRRRASLKISSG